MLSGFFLKKKPPCSMPETARELENCSNRSSPRSFLPILAVPITARTEGLFNRFLAERSN